jgi:hypothetical protein
MKPARIAAHLGARLMVLNSLVAVSAAFAQAPQPTPYKVDGAPVPPQTTLRDIAPAPGLPGPASVNPDPGAQGAYAGHSEHTFYDVRGRIAKVEAKIGANLAGAEQHKAMVELNSIKSEERSQIARHGSLLDWARENLNHRLDLLVQSYPALQG